jgi:tetratricopeptide (TPR) repeat protein
MKTILACSLALACTGIFANLQAQTNTDKAIELGRKAVSLVDSGKVTEGIVLLREAQGLDPDNPTYPYEIAYAYYTLKDYPVAIEILDSLRRLPRATENVFQLLGTSYDFLGDSVKADQTYKAGLTIYPRSGRLYLELGILNLNSQPVRALKYFEDGIASQPGFASNYYWASKIFLQTTEKVWAMIYGEIFMNLERGSKRTEEMSERLYKAYLSGIERTSDSTFAVHFSKSIQVAEHDSAVPFPMAYELCMALATVPTDTVEMNSLSTIRSRFLDLWEEKRFQRAYGHPIFAYQLLVQRQGHLDAYSHWLLMQGDEDAFSSWHSSHEKDFEDFLKWFRANPLKLGPTDVTVRSPR